MERYTQTYEISSHDVDINNNARPSIITRYMQETANHHMRDRRPTYYELFAEGKSYILTRIAFEVYEQLHPYDVITVGTWVTTDKGATFTRSYSVEKEGRQVVKCYGEWAVADRNTGRLCRTDEIDSSNYETGEKNILSVPIRFRLPKDLEMEAVGVKKVLYSECDMNLHMNNTYYPDILWSHLPDPGRKKLTSISMRFMAEAPMGGDMEIFRSLAPEALVDGAGAEETYYFLTSVGGKTNLEAMVSAAPLNEEELWIPA